jgi:hypothetical protein
MVSVISSLESAAGRSHSSTNEEVGDSHHDVTVRFVGIAAIDPTATRGWGRGIVAMGNVSNRAEHGRRPDAWSVRSPK